MRRTLTLLVGPAILQRLAPLVQAGLVAALLLGPGAAVAQDPVYDYHRSDPAMKTAIAQARRTLPRFLAALSDGSGTGFSVKAPIPDDRGSHVHIWLSDVTVEGGDFVGRIANEPARLSGYGKGSPYRLRRSAISDWYFFRGGKMHGSYTTRAMLSRLPADEAASLRAILAP